MELPKIIEKHREYLESTYLPTNEITFLIEETKPWESKLGGCLYLEDIDDYPIDPNGNPMIFLAQLNLEEMKPLSDFPKTGILQFFIDDAHGRDFDCFVKYIPEYKKDETKLIPLNPYSANPNYQEDEPFERSGKIIFKDKIMPITTSAGNFDDKFHDEASEEEWDALHIFCYDEGSRVGGYPYFVQSIIPTYEDGIDVLLLQLDFEDVCWLDFGDAGTCNFFISKENLLNRNFSDVIYDWQCC